jgi:hypothetical protein
MFQLIIIGSKDVKTNAIELWGMWIDVNFLIFFILTIANNVALISFT